LFLDPTVACVITKPDENPHVRFALDANYNRNPFGAVS
jgi:hypothetical protein